MSDGPHFGVGPPFDGTQLKQIQDAFRATSVTVRCRKDPTVFEKAIVVFPTPIPGCTFLVSAMNPACQRLGNQPVDRTERLRSDDVSVVIAPSTEFGVQPGQETCGWCTHLGPDEFLGRL